MYCKGKDCLVEPKVESSEFFNRIREQINKADEENGDEFENDVVEEDC